jgi:hypothetical protein
MLATTILCLGLTSGYFIFKHPKVFEAHKKPSIFSEREQGHNRSITVFVIIWRVYNS